MRFYSVLEILLLEILLNLQSMLSNNRWQIQQYHGSADSPSVNYPARLRFEAEYLDYTHFGRFGLSESLEVYAWPLLWTNSYTGKYRAVRSLCLAIEPYDRAPLC